ncbi:hypothetical protein HANVADRAFT_1059 [Hanseniaspora valbyensis NRRL Y-1626]|uniref:Uncharacterized protein n=1 Tax=Hanseniaspora valbyensis NRRL Y-1626 TaxID=766949 RepID=A0A1B7TGV4_9ASCO|nr:hypothetical protein HANVADRAFT_1059 [Hanseniaspora valbyensis NRRL Y-1626]
MRNFQLSLTSALLLSKLTNASPVLTKKEESSQSHIAPEISNNPTDVVYRADFPFFNSPNVVGIVQFYSINGTTKVHVDLTGLPRILVSFHIMFMKMQTMFNCDTFEDDSKCQVGDLSGNMVN